MILLIIKFVGADDIVIYGFKDVPDNVSVINYRYLKNEGCSYQLTLLF